MSSTPATGGTTYLEGETIEFTATFTAPVTVTGSPTFTFTLGEETREATYAGGSESLALVFSYIVQAGEIDSDGISWGANAFELNGGTIQQTIDDTKAAALEHPAQREALGAHRVDADPPGEPVSAIMQGTTLKLRYDEALDAASAPAVGAYTLTAGSEPNRTPDTVVIDDRTVTLTFATAPADGAEVTLTYTVPASNPVKDAGGNAAPGFTGLTVVRGPVVRSINPGDPPTTKPAVDDYTEEQLSSNVLGLKRWKLPEMKAHGRGATLTFKVPFDRPVTVTGAPTLKLDLWGETRTARYVGGSRTDTLTFTWGPVLTGDNDFDGIEVKELVLAGATIRDTNNRDFVANSYGGEHLPQHKIFGGFHEMWIERTESYAVEGERYEFRVRRTGERSRDPGEESHYVLVGITDSAFTGTPALGRYEGSDNGPGVRSVMFDHGEPEGHRGMNMESPISVTPPDDEGPTEGRTMTLALHATHFTVNNERGELAHRIYMPRNLEGVTVPVLPFGTALAGAAPAIVGTPAVSAPQAQRGVCGRREDRGAGRLRHRGHRRRDRRQPDACHRARRDAPRRGLRLGLGQRDAALRA